MVERGGLENRCGCKVTVGSNPTLSASPISGLRRLVTEGAVTEGLVTEGAVTEKLSRRAPRVGQMSANFTSGEMTEWPKVHDWKSCVGSPPTVGSNPTLSAIIKSGWGSSSVGRAPGSQSGGRGFDPHLLHQGSLFFSDCRFQSLA